MKLLLSFLLLTTTLASAIASAMADSVNTAVVTDDAVAPPMMGGSVAVATDVTEPVECCSCPSPEQQATPSTPPTTPMTLPTPPPIKTNDLDVEYTMNPAAVDPMTSTPPTMDTNDLDVAITMTPSAVGAIVDPKLSAFQDELPFRPLVLFPYETSDWATTTLGYVVSNASCTNMSTAVKGSNTSSLSSSPISLSPSISPAFLTVINDVCLDEDICMVQDAMSPHTKRLNTSNQQLHSLWKSFADLRLGVLQMASAPILAGLRLGVLQMASAPIYYLAHFGQTLTPKVNSYATFAYNKCRTCYSIVVATVVAAPAGAYFVDWASVSDLVSRVFNTLRLAALDPFQHIADQVVFGYNAVLNELANHQGNPGALVASCANLVGSFGSWALSNGYTATASNYFSRHLNSLSHAWANVRFVHHGNMNIAVATTTTAAAHAWNGATTGAANAWNEATTATIQIWNGATTGAANAWNGATTATIQIWNGATTATIYTWNEFSQRLQGPLSVFLAVNMSFSYIFVGVLATMGLVVLLVAAFFFAITGNAPPGGPPPPPGGPPPPPPGGPPPPSGGGPPPPPGVPPPPPGGGPGTGPRTGPGTGSDTGPDTGGGLPPTHGGFGGGILVDGPLPPFGGGGYVEHLPSDDVSMSEDFDLGSEGSDVSERKSKGKKRKGPDSDNDDDSDDDDSDDDDSDDGDRKPKAKKTKTEKSGSGGSDSDDDDSDDDDSDDDSDDPEDSAASAENNTKKRKRAIASLQDLSPEQQAQLIQEAEQRAQQSTQQAVQQAARQASQAALQRCSHRNVAAVCSICRGMRTRAANAANGVRTPKKPRKGEDLGTWNFFNKKDGPDDKRDQSHFRG